MRRLFLVSAVAALVGVALADDAGHDAPAGVPDVSGYAWPGAAILTALLLKNGGPTVTLRVVNVKDDKNA